MPNLDFLRSVAVISVVAEHTLLALGIQRIGPYDVAYMGVLGVLVFFVLTALVLMWSLERRPHTLDFYIRRFFRIYPLAWAVIAIAFLFHAPTAGTPTNLFAYANPTSWDILGQSTLIQPAHAALVGVMWSLPYEVTMYVLLPAMFFFVRQNFSLWPLLTLWTLVLFNSRHVPVQGHNFIVAVGYFLPGIMAYVGFGRLRALLPGWTLIPFLFAMWALFLYRCNFHKGWYFCLVIGLMLPLFHQMTSKWILEPSRIIARYSYGIYLTHPFAIVIGIYLLRGYSTPVRVLGELIPLLVLPLAAYHLLEHPMIRLGSRVAAKAEARYEQQEMKRFRETPA